MDPPIRPVIIAHRGASGYLPEHTFPAKALAVAMGADYLEQDVVATRDDELVVLHDVHLDRVTDVAERFPGRERDDGRFYVRDFTLDEVRSLSVHDRTNADDTLVYPGRARPESADDGDLSVHTFSEELAYVGELQETVGRTIGIYPEIKRPEWHRSEGFDITPAFLAVLASKGYEAYNAPVYVQCFDNRELLRIRDELGCELRLIQLIGDNSWGESGADYESMLTTKGLKRLAKTVDGIGPWINQLYRLSPKGAVEDSGLVARAHAVGLAVHPFTFRSDDLPPGFETFTELLRFTIDELSVDGLFTDFPDQV